MVVVVLAVPVLVQLVIPVLTVSANLLVFLSALVSLVVMMVVVVLAVLVRKALAKAVNVLFRPNALKIKNRIVGIAEKRLASLMENGEPALVKANVSRILLCHVENAEP
jgi:hypothetical protein